MPKVLIIDDDLTLNQMYEERLQMEGYQVLTARNGQEALEIGQKAKPDLILLDIMMPGLDGFAVLEKFRQLSQTRKTPIILVTALIQETVRIKGNQLGATDYLVKSEITPAQLVAKIKQYLALKPKSANGTLEEE